MLLQVEINSTNDNPILVPSDGEGYNIFHVGHFHGQYIAMAMDHVAIALTTLSNLADRRIDRYMKASNSNGLPPFLCKEDPGIRQGLMPGQYLAASVTAENRSLCNPVSVQTLPTTADFQDIVPFSLVAARRAREILTNATYAISFEVVAGCQAADLRGFASRGTLSKATTWLYHQVRARVPYLDHDTPLTDYLEATADILADPEAFADMESTCGATEL